MTQLDAEFAAASLEGYERVSDVCNRFTVNGEGSYQRGATCGFLQGFVANLARATSRECAHEALLHTMADFGGARQERPARESAGFIFAIWISGAALGAMLAGVAAVLAR